MISGPFYTIISVLNASFVRNYPRGPHVVAAIWPCTCLLSFVLLRRLFSQLLFTVQPLKVAERNLAVNTWTALLLFHLQVLLSSAWTILTT